MIRIISGKYKGLRLDAYNIKGTRPTMDRVKESLFSIIQNELKSKRCLDLFAGSGSLGLEAISNGANEVYFVDKNIISTNFIKDIKNRYNIDNIYIINKSYEAALKMFKEKNIKFDIIFLDPPYNLNIINDSISLIEKYDLLNNNGLIICEYEYENIMSNYDLIKEKKYGSKNIKIYKRTQ